MNKMLSGILDEAKEYLDTMIANRRYLHTHAETGFDLNDTIAYVKKQLTEMGYEPKECGKCGLVATIGGKERGKTFLLRADMDALPIKEEADIDFPSTNGCMHACGHDMHTAMLLGAARILKNHEEEIAGTVKLMFQAAEEIFEGAEDMMENGLLNDPKVDAAFMIHVMAGMPFPAGTVIVSAPGISAPAADCFEITIKGKGCHGSMPHTGVDPLNAAAHILIALQEINARELSMNSRAVLTIGMLNGGAAPNVIPDEVTMGGSIRTFDETTRETVKSRVKEISEGIAKTFRAEASLVFTSGCPTLRNDTILSESAYRYAKELLGNENVYDAKQLQAMSGGGGSDSAGSEDFAHVSQKVPSVMVALAAGQPENGYRYPQHHPKVKFDESALSNGSAVYAYVAMRWLKENKNS